MIPSIYKRLKINRSLALYLSLILVELLATRTFSDLPTTLSNWAPNSEELIHFKIPKDNFYGPGGAILLAPFLWDGPNYFFAIITYSLLGFTYYYQITIRINSQKFRMFALSLPLVNVYLFWLFYTSQDTVFEFFLYMGFLYYLIENDWLRAIIFGVLLAETRSGYWAILLCGVLALKFLSKFTKSSFDKRLLIFFPSLILIAFFNYINYGSFTPAQEGGMTANFSYAKHHYLSLPKFDLDVFLSGKNGDLADPILKADLAKAKNDTEKDRAYFENAIRSIKSYPKETVLGWMQKFESHFISIQKIPNLPGNYQYNVKINAIEIEEERLTWPLIVGNLIYEVYRLLILILGISAFGIYLGIKKFHPTFDARRLHLSLIFWIFSAIPALLFYSETRFKIVQEVSLIPLIIMIWSSLFNNNANSNLPHH